jgi:hypothetical protein
MRFVAVHGLACSVPQLQQRCKFWLEKCDNNAASMLEKLFPEESCVMSPAPVRNKLSSLWIRLHPHAGQLKVSVTLTAKRSEMLDDMTGNEAAHSLGEEAIMKSTHTSVEVSAFS